MKFKLGDWVVPKDIHYSWFQISSHVLLHPFTSPYMMMEIIDIRKIPFVQIRLRYYENGEKCRDMNSWVDAIGYEIDVVATRDKKLKELGI
jgi:hypothetical protein